MWNIFKNKLFILFLILLVAIFPIRVAQAGGSFNILNVIIGVVLAVVLWQVAPLIIPEITATQGGLAVATGIVSEVSLASIAINVAFEIGAGLALCAAGVNNAYWSGCGDSSGGGIPTIVSSEVGGCRYQIPLTFYIPSYQRGYRERIFYYDSDGNPVELPAETQRYRPCSWGWRWGGNNEQNKYDCGTEEQPNNCAVPDSSGYYVKTQLKNFLGYPQEQCLNLYITCELFGGSSYFVPEG
ncbi:MAG: hypothetical protein AB1472_04745, partial [Candidatus Omnitrophota bacterium]